MGEDIVIHGVSVSDTTVDKLTAINKGLLGMLPAVGSILSEIFGSLIPQQRMDRVAAVLKIFDAKIAALEMSAEVLQNLMTAETFVDLFEDAMFQGARALSDERREYIASFLVNSLTQEELAHLQEKRLLALLGELNDIEILILKYHSLRLNAGQQQEFYTRHADVIAIPRPYMGGPEEDTKQYAIHKSYIAHLESLNLLQITYKKPKKDQLHEMDLKTGKIEAKGVSISVLGKLLLQYIEDHPKQGIEDGVQHPAAV